MPMTYLNLDPKKMTSKGNLIFNHVRLLPPITDDQQLQTLVRNNVLSLEATTGLSVQWKLDHKLRMS